MPIAAETLEGNKLDLAAEVIRSGGTIRLRALGTSMLPTIWPGDILTIQRGEIVPGDIVLVSRDQRFFVHRLVEQRTAHWITRGDSLPQNDARVTSSQVLGRVSIIHRKTGDVIPSRRRSLSASVLAWLLSRSDTFRNLLLRTHSLWRRVHDVSYGIPGKCAALQPHQ